MNWVSMMFDSVHTSTFMVRTPFLFAIGVLVLVLLHVSFLVETRTTRQVPSIHQVICYQGYSQNQLSAATLSTR